MHCLDIAYTRAGLLEMVNDYPPIQKVGARCMRVDKPRYAFSCCRKRCFCSVCEGLFRNAYTALQIDPQIERAHKCI